MILNGASHIILLRNEWYARRHNDDESFYELQTVTTHDALKKEPCKRNAEKGTSSVWFVSGLRLSFTH